MSLYFSVNVFDKLVCVWMAVDGIDFSIYGAREKTESVSYHRSSRALGERRQRTASADVTSVGDEITIGRADRGRRSSVGR